MAYQATPHSTTVFSPNVMVYGKENAMPCDIMYGQTGAVYNRQHGCFCEYVVKLRTNMVLVYVRAHQTMSIAANRQRIYHDEETATRFFKPGDCFFYWNKPKSLQTLSSGWTGPFVVVEKVTPIDYTIQFALDGRKNTVHCDELQMDPCDQNRPNWVKDELVRVKYKILQSVLIEWCMHKLRQSCPHLQLYCPVQGPLP